MHRVGARVVCDVSSRLSCMALAQLSEGSVLHGVLPGMSFAGTTSTSYGHLSGGLSDRGQAGISTCAAPMQPKALASSPAGILRLPDALQEALSNYIQDSDLRPRDVCTAAKQVSNEIRQLGAVDARHRSHARLTAAAADAEAGYLDSAPEPGSAIRPRARKRKEEIDRAIADMEQKGMHTLDAATFNAALGLPPPLSEEAALERRISDLVPRYDKRRTLGYALSRAVPTYAAVYRVLAEAGSKEKLKAGHCMVVGGRAGSGAWAIGQVWPGAVRNIIVVEPSAPMAELGRRCQEALAGALTKEAEAEGVMPRLPRVSWVKQMPVLGKGSPLKHRYDIVLCSYQLCEIPTEDGRRQLLRKLWDLTGGILVIVEPGTPGGFANVRDAREQVLGQEERRYLKMLQREDLKDTASQGTSPPKNHGFGAHVIAPCAHDGACPMQGKRMWCHFGQRMERPSFMAMDGTKRSYHDEEFSYVVLKRGPRPADAQIDPAALLDPNEWEPMKKTGQRDRSAGQSDKGGGQSDGGSKWKPRLFSSEEAGDLGGHVMDSSANKRVSNPAAPDEGLNWHLPESVIRRQVMLNRGITAIDDAFHPSPPSSSSSSSGGQSPEGQQHGPISSNFARKFPSYGVGLLDRLIAMEDQGVSWDRAPKRKVSELGDRKPVTSVLRQGLPLQTAELSLQVSLGALNSVSGESGTSSAEVQDAGGRRYQAVLGAYRGDDDGEGKREEVEEKVEGDHSREGKEEADHSEEVEEEEEDEAEEGDELGPLHIERNLAFKLPTEDERALAVLQLKEQVFGIKQGGSSDNRSAAAGTAGADAGPEVEDDGDGEEDAGFELDPVDTKRWGRVYRPPRARGGHVILDLCVPDLSTLYLQQQEQQQGEAGGPKFAARVERGRLERHVITRSDAKGQLGPGAWNLARRVEWGGLWPRQYMDRNRKIEPVQDPDLKARIVAQQRADAAAAAADDDDDDDDEDDDDDNDDDDDDEEVAQQRAAAASAKD